MIEIILAVVATSIVVSGLVAFFAVRKYRAAIRAEAEEKERMAKLEVARMRDARRRERQAFINSQFNTTATPKTPPKQVVTSVAPQPTTYTSDDTSDVLTALILNQVMNSPTGVVKGSVSWDNDVPTVTPDTTESKPSYTESKPSYSSSYSSSSSDDDSSSSSRSSYSSSYSSSSSDSSYSSSSSDSSYSSSSDSGSSSFSSD
jgi:hypothetical protein